MKIIFMGTPDFGEPAFKMLTESRHQIVAVYTQKPKEAGRGLKLIKSRIHQLADKFHIDVHTPVNLRSREEIRKFNDIKADIAVVAAYGMILPEDILTAPARGCINIHPSLLPKWRGAAPIQRALMAGDKRSGVCIMKMEEGLDSGDIILKEEFEIAENADAQWLHDKCANLGAELLLKALELIEERKAKYIKQNEKAAIYAKKITKEDEKLDLRKNGTEIINKIHALSPYPGTNLTIEGVKYKIFAAEFVKSEPNSIALDDLKESGTILNDKFHIKCEGGHIAPKIIQKEGKQRMNIGEFLKGNKVSVGKIIS